MENRMTITDEQMVFILLQALPSSYSHIVGTILAAGPLSALTPQDLVQRFLNEESRLSGPSATLNKVAPVKSSKPRYNQPRASSSNSPPSTSSDQEVTCFYCGKKGHKKPDCHKLKKDMENAQKGKEGQRRKATHNNNIEMDSQSSDGASLTRLHKVAPAPSRLFTTVNGSGRIEEVHDVLNLSVLYGSHTDFRAWTLL